MPKGYSWGMQQAERKNKKGRAMGGLIMGIRKELKVEETEINIEEGIIIGKIKIGKEKWKVIGVYVREDMERKIEKLNIESENKEEEERLIIGGDFNARTGEEGSWWEGGDEEEEEDRCVKNRNSKDSKVNRDGRKLIDFMGEKGWSILNGRMRGDEQGEYTYTGARGNTVIDYIIAAEDTRDRIEKMEVEDKTDSDHHPVVAWIKGRVEVKTKEGEKRDRRDIWDEEGREKFREALKRKEIERGELQQEIKSMNRGIKEVIEECEKERKDSNKRKRGWWDKECAEVKRMMRRGLRRWRRGKGEEKDYREMKGIYREICGRKRKEEEERLIREIGEANTEGKVWEIVNRERKCRSRINDEIGEEEWRDYFMGLLGGVSERVVRGTRREKREVDSEIERGEVGRVLRNLRDNKAMGRDGIGNEPWKYGGEEMEKWVWETCNRVWKGEGWPEEWKEGIIVPLIKKGQGNEVKDYRGITLMPTLYKIYVAILEGRLKQELENKKILKENQTGFRKGKGVIDCIYVLNYLAHRQMTKEKGKLIALFIDLKAAFDSVDRQVLIKVMRERGIGAELIERIEEMLRETKRSKSRRGGGKKFLDGKGSKAGVSAKPYIV